MKVGFYKLATALVLILAWEFIPSWGEDGVFPPLHAVLAATGEMLVDSDFWANAGSTLLAVALGFVISVPLALAAGYFMGRWSWLQRAFGPLIGFMVGIPKSIFLPLLILTLGLGLIEKVTFGIIQAFFIVAVTMTTGMREATPELLEFARSQKAGGWQLFWHVYWPAATPMVVEGARLGLIYTVTGVLLAEMYGSRHGIGLDIAFFGRLQNMESLFAVILLVSIAAVLVSIALSSYEARVGKWRRA